MKSQHFMNSLSFQMILSFILVVILTAITVGVPAIWLINEQLERQAYSQVEQGQRATLALYHARQSEIESLAILTAQRPTLQEMFSQQNWSELEVYLDTLKTSAGLDMMVLCNMNQEILVPTQTNIPMDIGNVCLARGYQYFVNGEKPQVWLLASYPIENRGSDVAEVVVAILLDDKFANQMRNQTGLEHTILANGKPVASSFAIGLENIAQSITRSIPSQLTSETLPSVLTISGEQYFSTSIPINELDLEAYISLNVAEITATRNRLVWILVISISIVAVLGSALGIFLAQRISRPLVRLADVAEEFRKGDLSSSVIVDAPVREVNQVAQALENARVELQRTMTNLEQEKAWINHLLESIVEGIMTLNADGKITYFSDGAERITGWHREEVLDRSCDTIFRLAQTEALFSQNIPAPDIRKKLVIVLAKGNQAVLAFTRAQFSPLEADDAEVVLVFRDVSDEEVIQGLLGDFLANIAHEFRTPLSALAASIELLLDQAPELNEAELRELLNSIHLGTLGLQTLVDNLLEGASIQAGRFRISPRQNDLGQIIARAAQTMQPLLDKYQQHLIVELPFDTPEVYADARRTEQVLVNLLSNASKFGPSDAEIKLLVAPNHDYVKVSVVDQGPGIPLKQRKQVFHSYTHPGPITDGAKMGAGLGLSVVKAIVEGHGGQVDVNDNPSGGAIFWFTLPIAKER